MTVFARSWLATWQPRRKRPVGSARGHGSELRRSCRLVRACAERRSFLLPDSIAAALLLCHGWAPLSDGPGGGFRPPSTATEDGIYVLDGGRERIDGGWRASPRRRARRRIDPQSLL